MKFVVLCPYVHEPQFVRMWATLHPTLRDAAIVLDNREQNIGCAGSRNVGARALIEADAEWLVDISPATRFGPPGGVDFLDYLAARPDHWVVETAAPVVWHCIAWHRRVFDTVGFWDENYWPIYGEDGDMSRRIHIAAAEAGDPNERPVLWDAVPTDAWVTMYGHSQRLGGVTIDQERIWAYYVAKWGGRSGEETYVRPFGRLDVGLDWWPRPPDARAYDHEGWER